jgi:chromosomal replication initiation ATPase DnaA
VIRPCIHGYMPGKCSKHKDCPNHKKPRLMVIDAALQAQADELGAIVAAEWRVELATIKGSARYKQPSEARLVLYYVLRSLGWTGPVIAAAVGGREHSQVYHGLRRLAINMACSGELRERVERVVSRAKQGAIPDLGAA